MMTLVEKGLSALERTSALSAGNVECKAALECGRPLGRPEPQLAPQAAIRRVALRAADYRLTVKDPAHAHFTPFSHSRCAY
jgi:hypothetical protein